MWPFNKKEEKVIEDPCIHQWGKWKPMGDFYQKRTCIKCGFSQEEKFQCWQK